MKQELILVVDDEKDILDLAGYDLEEEGFKVLKAADGPAALKSAQEEIPSLPGMRCSMLPGETTTLDLTAPSTRT